MMTFERNNEGAACGLNGTAIEIIQDLIICIGCVHQSMKQQSEEGAKALRVTIEHFCKHGSEVNEALFDHFDDPNALNEAMRRENMKQSAMTAKALKEIMEALDMDFDEDEDESDD